MATTVVIPNPIGVTGPIKISAAISASLGPVVSGTVYTAPASSYAKVNVNFDGSSGSATSSFAVGGVPIEFSNAHIARYGVIIGPSQSLTIDRGSAGTVSCQISGALFANL